MKHKHQAIIWETARKKCVYCKATLPKRWSNKTKQMAYGIRDKFGIFQGLFCTLRCAAYYGSLMFLKKHYKNII